MPFTYHVKVRKIGKDRWKFLGGEGRVNSLRIHASMFSEEDAVRIANDINTDSPEWEAKIQPIDVHARKGDAR